MTQFRGKARWESLLSNRGVCILALIAIGVAAAFIYSPFLINCKKFSFILFAAALMGLPCNELFTRCATVPADEAAWHEFFRRYSRDITAAIYRVIGFPPNGRFCHLFDDVVQRFRLRLLENNRRTLRSFRGRTDFEARSFLRKVSTSVAVNVLRSEPRGVLSLEEQIYPNQQDSYSRGEMISDRASPSEDFILLRNDVERCLNQVLGAQNKYRSMLIFKLALYDGFSPDEIASVAGLQMDTPHAVEQQISRIRQKIRKYLDKH